MRAFTSQLIVFALLGLFLGWKRNVLSARTGCKIVEEIEKIPALIKKTLSLEKDKINH